MKSLDKKKWKKIVRICIMQIRLKSHNYKNVNNKEMQFVTEVLGELSFCLGVVAWVNTTKLQIHSALPRAMLRNLLGCMLCMFYTWQDRKPQRLPQ